MLRDIELATMKSNELKRIVWLMRYSENEQADALLDEAMRLIHEIHKEEVAYIVNSNKN